MQKGKEMREIKFRAWDEQKKVMHFDFQFIKSGDRGNDWIIFKSDKENFNGNFNPYFSQQLKIMQYTGLKDKNGVEIYEGDVIRMPNKKKLQQVVFKRGFFQMPEYFIDETDEVIGNIYENPELLEQIKCGS